MLKIILPESQDFGEPSVEILKISSKGLDKTASMQKRAASFQQDIARLKVMPKRAYLHVITTGAGQFYNSNLNGDYWVGTAGVLRPPMPKTAAHKEIQLDGGLEKYHDLTYMAKAAVYQEHQTTRQGVDPSGEIAASHYNHSMHRGELLIGVDTDKWAQRLHKKASGHDIFLSIGADVSQDRCSACGNSAKKVDDYCEHIKRAKLQLLEDGTRICMINDDPKFYDISGVNVPADKMAFVLRKVASGQSVQRTIKIASAQFSHRRPMPFNKASALLQKLSRMEKEMLCRVEDDPLFKERPEAIQKFLQLVENYPVDQVIAGCNRKSILLSPRAFLKLLGKDSDSRKLFDTAADSCSVCGKDIMQDMKEDPMFAQELVNGDYDTACPADLRLDSILQDMVSELGVSRPAVNSRSIRIVLSPEAYDEKGNIVDELQQAGAAGEESDDTESKQKKAALLQDELRRGYARYVISFAGQNNQDTCRLALHKLARYIR